MYDFKIDRQYMEFRNKWPVCHLLATKLMEQSVGYRIKCMDEKVWIYGGGGGGGLNVPFDVSEYLCFQRY